MSSFGLGVFNSLFSTKSSVPSIGQAGTPITGSGGGSGSGTKVGGGGRGSGSSSRKRCPRGSRRNRTTGECVRVSGYTAKKRCPRGTRRSKASGACEKIETLLRNVSKSQRQISTVMKSSADKVNEVAKTALVEVAELKKADAAVASAGVDRLAAARAAAKLKREKKSAAAAARVSGKLAAAEAREKKAAEFEEDKRKEREAVLAKIEKTRKAMGIRKNEHNPAALQRLIEEWETEANVRLFKKYH